MRFVASLTRGAGELLAMQKLWKESGDSRQPFENVLITPLFMPPSGFKLIRDWREQGIIRRLYFDSGGFYVQMGRISYNDLYYPLLDLYRRERWADYYVLPDHVPLSSDEGEKVWVKIQDTVHQSASFFRDLPGELQERAMPVVHGFTHRQVEYCLEGHLKLNTTYLGFGSFETSGNKGASNKLSQNAYRNIKYITVSLAEKGVCLHGFGVGTPPVIYALSLANVFSFDSVGWMKTAGFGKVFLPFVRAYNITYYDSSATTLTRNQFIAMKEETHHECYFCQSFDHLHKYRYFRALHNLAVILDMLEGASHDFDVSQTIRRYSPNYTYLLGDS